MDYSKLSDFDIDAAVAKIKFPGLKITNFAGEAVVWFGNLETRVVRYCNNPADAWPIILCNRITLMPASKSDKWMAQAFDYAIADVSINPLRSAMIVFLMMQGSE